MFTEEVMGINDVRVMLVTVAENFKEGMIEAVFNTAKDTQEDIQLQMPVDTGWAQARFGEPVYGGFWDTKDGGLTIEFGSDIGGGKYVLFGEKGHSKKVPYEYIIRLNEGSSTQAPAGFIDAAAANGEGKLEYAIDAAIAKWTDR